MEGKTRQAYDVLDYMTEHQGITSKQANDDLGITRLSAVVYQLKKMGCKIETEIKTGIDRRGQRTWWKVYRIAN
jgi:hypothetical protein